MSNTTDLTIPNIPTISTISTNILENYDACNSDLSEIRLQDGYEELQYADISFYRPIRYCLSDIFEKCKILDEIIQIDKVIRGSLTKIPLKSIKNEYELGNYILIHQHEILHLKNYPYVIGREYFVNSNHSNEGIGDFLFTDGNGHFLVVEIKFLPDRTDRVGQNRNEKKKRKVKNQAITYARCLEKFVSTELIEYVGVTNKNMHNIPPKRLKI